MRRILWLLENHNGKITQTAQGIAQLRDAINTAENMAAS
jgi:hypothetical protein